MKGKKRSKPCEVPRVIVVDRAIEENETRKKWVSTCDHHFIQKIQIFLPISGKSDDFELFPSLPSFAVAVVRPEGFLDRFFLDSYAKQAGLYCLSVGPSVDRHNTCAIFRGKLVLSVCTETYGQLGLSGVRSSFKGREFYFVEIDIESPKFSAGNKEYDRARWCLSRMQPCQFLATCFSEGSSSIVEFPREYCEEQSAAACLSNRRIIAEDIRIPTMSEFKQEAVGNELYHDIFEWLGFLHNGFLSCIRKQPPADEFPTILRSPVECSSTVGRGVVYEVLRKEMIEILLNTPSPAPAPSTHCTDRPARSPQVRGFIPGPAAATALDAAARAVRRGAAPWASVAMWGFESRSVRAWRACASRARTRERERFEHPAPTRIQVAGPGGHRSWAGGFGPTPRRARSSRGNAGGGACRPPRGAVARREARPPAGGDASGCLSVQPATRFVCADAVRRR